MDLALFDFDGTITKRETISEFLRFCVGDKRFFLSLFQIAPVVLGYVLGKVGNREIKESLLSRTVGGWDEDLLIRKGKEFAIKRLPLLVRSEALERIEWHRARGDRIVLVSASLIYYLRPWAETIGIKDVIGVELEVQGGKITGRLLGENCYGKEKVRRIKSSLCIESFGKIYAYGDSRGDADMLSLADYPFFRPFR